MHTLGKISIIGFLCGFSTISIPTCVEVVSVYVFLEFCLLHSSVCQIISASILYVFKKSSWKMKMHVILRSYLLGFGFSIGQLLVWKNVDRAFGSYLSVLCCFHYSEFLVTSVINPSALSLDSFLLNHSMEYGMAAGASWLEYAIELYLFPGLKLCQWPMKIGLFFCIAGELLRKGAMLTAWSNFTHLVRETRVEGHKLVTHGIFSLCRHPSYAGWFWWSIGTQLVLVNPVCTIGYTLASWRFFYGRIYYEEATLLSFFGHKYFQYQENVKHTGVPFVPGYIFEKQQQQMNQQEQPPQRRPVEQYQRFDDQSGGSDTQEDASDTN